MVILELICKCSINSIGFSVNYCEEYEVELISNRIIGSLKKTQQTAYKRVFLTVLAIFLLCGRDTDTGDPP